MSKPISRYLDFRQRRLEGRMAVCWVLGLLLGAAGRCLWPYSFGTGLYAGSRFSVPLPFVWVLVSPVLAWGFPEWGLAFLAALTAACFSWTALGLRLLFGSAGWLLWPLLLFPELLLFPFLLFLWLRLLSGRRFVALIFLYFAAAAAICLADLCLVMPFAAFLIESK